MYSEKNQRLYIQIANQIVEYLKLEQLTLGQRLPTERDMAAIFGVSRASIREALIALEMNGVVEIRQGVGIVVCNASPQAIGAISGAESVSPSELLEAREMLEPKLAALAARKVKDQDIVRLTELVQLMEGALMLETAALREALSVEADRMFHQHLAAVADNALLTRVVDQLWAKDARGSLWDKMDELAYASNLRPRWIADHKQILSAVSQRDELGAEKAMYQHICNVRDSLTTTELLNE